MCFSATASFSASAALVAVGALSWSSARTASERPFAAIPVLFAIQQVIEGALWLTFGTDHDSVNAAMTYIFTFFSHLLWPVFVPLAVLLMEPSRPRRLALLALVAGGAGVSSWLFIEIAGHGVSSRPVGHHIEYLLPYSFGAATMTLYLLSTGVSMLLSSHRAVKAFGLLALLSFVVAAVAYVNWLVSVWCYFAALLSVVVLWHLRPEVFGLRVRPA